MSSRLRRWAEALVLEVHAVWLAARDRRTPLGTRLLGLGVAGYALSPIDLIPDFVPVLGLLDDLLIVPAGLWLFVRLVPPTVMADARAAAACAERNPRSHVAAALIIALWLAIALALAWAVRGVQFMVDRPDHDDGDDDEEVGLDPVITVARITAVEMMVGQMMITQLRILDRLKQIDLTPDYIRELAEAYSAKVDESTIIESSSPQVNYEFKLNVIHHLERFFDEMIAHLEQNP